MGIFELFRSGRQPSGGQPLQIEVGGVYSVVESSGMFGVVKVLAFEPDDDIVYARLYRAKTRTRMIARDIDFTTREPDALVEALGYGVGVLPVTQRLFSSWRPELMFVSSIGAAESDDLGECFGVALPWDDLPKF